jgi:predicted MFS family arabinose efflux permease
VISTGTTFGVVVAAGLAFAVTEGLLGWRVAWIGFALGGVALAGLALAGLPSSRRGRHPARDAIEQVVLTALPAVPDPEPAGARLTRRATLPLYATALCYGIANAVFLSFAADRVVAAGGLPGLPDEAASTVIFLAYGICGVVGLATGWIEARTGLAPLLCAIFAAAALSLVLIAVAPVSWIAVVAAAGLHGVAVMMVSAVFSFWSLRLFPGYGTLGFTATLLSVAVGSVVGPAVAGFLAVSLGPEVMFLAAAVPPLATSLWFGAKLGGPRPRLPPEGGAR